MADNDADDDEPSSRRWIARAADVVLNVLDLF